MIDDEIGLQQLQLWKSERIEAGNLQVGEGSKVNEAIGWEPIKDEQKLITVRDYKLWWRQKTQEKNTMFDWK